MIFIQLEGVNETLLTLSSIKEELPGCISRALNRSLEMVKTEQARRTMAKYRVKNSKILSSMNVFKSSKATLEGRVVSGGRPIGLDYFRLTPNTRGKKKKIVKAEVKRTGLKEIPNAFIAYHSGRLGAFVRTTDTSYPIRRLMAPSAPQMLGNTSILDYLQGYAEDNFQKRLEHELGRVMYK